LEWDKTACRFVFSYWTWTWTCLFWRGLGLGLGLGCCWTCYKSGVICRRREVLVRRCLHVIESPSSIRRGRLLRKLRLRFDCSLQ